MTKQQKVNRLEKIGYKVIFCYSDYGVIGVQLQRGNKFNRLYTSVNDAFKSKVGY